MEAATRYAIDRDVLIVIAAGNDARRIEDYPGSAETVLVVGATRLDDKRWLQTGGGRALCPQEQ